MGVAGACTWETMHAIDLGLIEYQIELFHDILGEKNAGDARKMFNKYFLAISSYMNQQSKTDFLRPVPAAPMCWPMHAWQWKRKLAITLCSCCAFAPKIWKFHCKVGSINTTQIHFWMHIGNRIFALSRKVNNGGETSWRSRCDQRPCRQGFVNGPEEMFSSGRFPAVESLKMHGTWMMATSQQLWHGCGQGWDSSHAERMHQHFLQELDGLRSVVLVLLQNK